MGAYERTLAERHARTTEWGAGVALGRSGRTYRAVAVPADASVEGEASVYALRLGGLWGWVGAAADLIEDPDSRARFRALCAAGASLFRLEVSADPRERMAIAWDLEEVRTPPRRSVA